MLKDFLIGFVIGVVIMIVGSSIVDAAVTCKPIKGESSMVCFDEGYIKNHKGYMFPEQLYEQERPNYDPYKGERKAPQYHYPDCMISKGCPVG